jgi:hypothetical protein
MTTRHTAALIDRLRQHEKGSRQQCTCRSDLPNCIMCDCGLAADEIERLLRTASLKRRAADPNGDAPPHDP